MSTDRRILSVWFSHFGVDRVLRQDGGDPSLPLAVVEETGNTQIVSSVNVPAQAEGACRGQPLRDARALCPGLRTTLKNPKAEAEFLLLLRRWARRFSPWVSENGHDGLVLDITGCAHLFGGEQALLLRLEDDAARIGVTARAGIADCLGAAWALARYAGAPPGAGRSGDDVDQEARATRSRAAKRRNREQGNTQPAAPTQAAAPLQRIAPKGRLHMALSRLPVAALRLEPETNEQLNRLGLRQIGDLFGQPRAPLTRRFGPGLVLRLDQALNLSPEPLSPEEETRAFSTRLTLPDPIGLQEDVMAAVDRLLPPLCAALAHEGRVARLIRLEAWRTDQSMQWVAVGLARPSAQAERIRPLLAMKLPQLEAGFGFDMLRLIAMQTEPQPVAIYHGRLDALPASAPSAALPAAPPANSTQGIEKTSTSGTHSALSTAREDLLARLGTRVGMTEITSRAPATSYLPGRDTLTLAAAWAEPALDWDRPDILRPLLLWPPELVSALTPTAPIPKAPPERFRWRGRVLRCLWFDHAERLSPEWWITEDEWRSGTRDYWRVTTDGGEQIWLFHAHGDATSGGWFCHGRFL